jgi:hypothetical protein
MLAVAMDQLDDGPGLAQRGIGPGLDRIPAVGRGEADFTNGHSGSSLCFDVTIILPWKKKVHNMAITTEKYRKNWRSYPL